MSLIPQITLNKLVLKIKNGGTIRSSEVYYGDKYVGTFIVPSFIGGATIFNEIKTHAEFLGVRGNIVIPHQEEDDSKLITCDECDFTTLTPIALAGHKRKHRVKA